MTSTGQPEPSCGCYLGGPFRDSFDWSPFMWRPRDVQSVLRFSQSECGPSATRLWHLTDRKLVVLRLSKTRIWPSHTYHSAEVSANHNAALVQLTMTPYGQKFGCPQAVRNQKFIMVLLPQPITVLPWHIRDRKSLVPLLFGTRIWPSWRHHGVEVLLSFAVFSEIMPWFVLNF